MSRTIGRAQTTEEWLRRFNDYCCEREDQWRLYHDTATIDVECADEQTLAALEEWKSKQGISGKDWTLAGDPWADALPPLDGSTAIAKQLREFLRMHLAYALAERQRKEVMTLRAFEIGYRHMSAEVLHRHMSAWLNEHPARAAWLEEDGLTIDDLIAAASDGATCREAA